jgi:hypothetical protein
MQTKSKTARIAAALAIAVILPVAIFIILIHGGKQPVAQFAAKSAAVASNASVKVSPADSLRVAEQFGKLPMSFAPNQGQSAPEVKFVSRGPGYDLFLTGQEAVMAIRHSSAKRTASQFRTPTPSERLAAHRAEQISVVRMKLDGANADAQVAGAAPLPGKINYFLGNDPEKWHADIPTYSQVKYSAVYPGIDLVYYGNQKRLEYDFIVAPGADPKAIAFDVNGARSMRVDKRGDLVMNTTGGDVTFQKPFVYQEVAGQRREVAGNYVVKNREVRFALGAYDASQPLTIDPSVLIYSTYLGGSGNSGIGDSAYGIALDSTGDAFVAGTTASVDFPTSNGLTPPPNIASGVTSAFVTEINPTGSQFLYSTFLGGSGNAGGSGDGADAIAVDASGSVFVSGYTSSPDFPTSTSGYLLTAPPSAATGGTAFVARLNPAGSGTAQLVYSTYLGGATYPAAGGLDEAHAIATDGQGNAYVGGVTSASDFPLLNAIVTTLNSAGGAGNAFVSEINTNGTGTASLVFSTYLGGAGGAGPSRVPYGDVVFGITVDSSGQVYATGATTSVDFKPAPAGGTPCGGGDEVSTAFLVKLNLTATPPSSAFSGCFGGSVDDTISNGVAIAPDKTAVITGQTFTTDITPTNVIPTPVGVPNATDSLVFVVKYNTTGTTPIAYSTLFGGEAGDDGYAVAVDSTGNIYVAGETNSGQFPVTQGALQATKSNPDGTAFVAKLNPAGGGATDLGYASYFGGAGQGAGNPDAAFSIAVSSSNDAYIAGQTSSANSGSTPFPISSGAKQSILNGPYNAFVAELPLVATLSVSPVSLDFGTQVVGAPTPAQYVTVTNNTASSVSLTIPPTFTGTNAADFAYSATGGTGTACTSTLAAGTACTVGVLFTPSVAAAESATLDVIDASDVATYTVALTGTGTATGAAISLNPSSLTFAGTLLTTSSAAQPVTVTNTGNSPLTITAIASSSSNFTESDNCTDGSIAAGATCTITVTFAPSSTTAPGPTSGTITLTDNANGSPQSIAVSGTAWDFNLTVPANASLRNGASTSLSVAINGLGGFTGNVGVACTSASSTIASCSVSPASGAPGSSVTVTVTSASMLAPTNTPTATPPVAMRQIVFAAIAMMMLLMVPMTRQWRTRLGLVAAMLVFVVIAGCSGHPTTKTTTLTITGTSGTVSKTYTTNVTVN